MRQPTQSVYLYPFDQLLNLPPQSLILAAANKPAYQKLIDVAVQYGKSKGGDLDAQANAAADRLVSLS